MYDVILILISYSWNMKGVQFELVPEKSTPKKVSLIKVKTSREVYFLID